MIPNRFARLAAPAVSAVLFLLCAALPAAGQSPRPYRSLAVMDLEVDGPHPGEMEDIVDYLTMRIRETHRFRRVVGRKEREELLSRKAQVQRSRDYQEEQLNRATRLSVQVAVLGRLSWDGQQYRLHLRLLEVKRRELLFERGGTFSSKGELYAACDRLAMGIAGAAVRPEPPEAAARTGPPLPEITPGFGLGQEGVSATSTVAGGSYLYVEALALLDRYVGLDLRYAFRLFPIPGGSHLLSTHLRLQVPRKKEVFVAAELGYLLSIGASGQLAHFAGLRLVPIAGGEKEFFFELLPVGIYFDVATGEAVFTLELLAVRFLFSRR